MVHLMSNPRLFAKRSMQLAKAAELLDAGENLTYEAPLWVMRSRKSIAETLKKEKLALLEEIGHQLQKLSQDVVFFGSVPSERNKPEYQVKVSKGYIEGMAEIKYKVLEQLKSQIEADTKSTQKGEK